MKTKLHSLMTAPVILLITWSLILLTQADINTLSDDDWVSMGALSGAYGRSGPGSAPVRTVAADNSGNLYAGGSFSAIGTVFANNIARWDGEEWAPLGAGIPGQVSDLVMLGGDLYAGGWFDEAGGKEANYIAKWDGEQWSGVGFKGHEGIAALAAMDGKLYAAHSGGVVMEWDGQNWSSLGRGMGGKHVNVSALATIENVLYAGGRFTDAHGTNADNIARWDGERWSPLGQGIMRGDDTQWATLVTALVVIDDELYVGGNFNWVDGQRVNHIAKWDGNAWVPLGEGFKPNGRVSALGVLDGDLYASVSFWEPNGDDVNHIAKWDGEQWSETGAERTQSGIQASSFATSGGRLYGTVLSPVNGASVVLNWDGQEWAPLDANPVGPDAAVNDLTTIGTDLYVAGEFASVDGRPANFVAKWDGSHWAPVGSGITGGSCYTSGTTVRSLAVMGDDLYVGGDFFYPGRLFDGHIAKWDGQEWLPLGTGLDSHTCGGFVGVSATAVLDDSLFAAGSFESAGGVETSNIARWDGEQWFPLGAGIGGEAAGSGLVRALTVINGDLYAGGDFSSADGKSASFIARWRPNLLENRGTWTPLGSGLNGEVSALAVLGNDLYVAGSFTMAGKSQANGFAKWDGSEWSAVGAGIHDGGVSVLKVFDGELFAGGQFTLACSAGETGIAKWDGVQWQPIASGFIGGGVSALALHGDQLYAGGGFIFAGGKPSAYLARAFLDGVPPVEVSDAGAMVHFRGLPAGQYQIERSTGLDAWSPVKMRKAGQTGGIDFMDRSAPEMEAFYRAEFVMASPPAVSDTPSPVCFVEDFESGAEGWTTASSAGETQWELGKPAAVHVTAAHSGDHVYGTDLDAPYANGVVASLRSPLFDLRGNRSPKLSFWYFVDTVFETEGVQLNILDEDGNLLHERDEIFWGTTDEWTQFSMFIPAEAKNQKIHLEWLLLTDAAEPNGDGFFLDDVMID
jgi:trimeric autotransporter adhesin